MIQTLLARVIGGCTRAPLPVIALFMLLGGAAAAYSAASFAISTDTNRLLPANLPWRQRQTAYDRLFPRENLLVVVRAPTPESVSEATRALAGALHGASISRVNTLGSGPFFDRSALLLMPLDRARDLADMLAASAPVASIVLRDPSLRGIASLLTTQAQGVATGRASVAQFERLLRDLASTFRAARSGRPPPFSWQETITGRSPDRQERRGFIGVQPVLDTSALLPGKAATQATRQAASRLDLAGRFGAHVALTGEVPINDEQFATLRHGQVAGTLGTAAAVLVVLWLALRSWRIIVAVALTIAVGLTITCALGLLMTGSFNLLSIAFAVLFVGLGADFGIQFGVRYRAERHDLSAGGRRPALREALLRSAGKAGVPLSLACAGTAVGFLSFVPTNYLGISELGLIAGVGMIVAFTTTMTLLPALLAVLAPPPEPQSVGFRAFAGADRFLARHRLVVVTGTLAAVAAGAVLLPRLRFDFNPTHLQLPSAPAVKTYRELVSNPQSGIAAIEIAAPSLNAATRLAARLDRLPEVAGTRTAASLIPSDQDERLALVARARAALSASLSARREAEPTDVDAVRALRDAAARLTELLAAAHGGLPAEAARMSSVLSALASAPQDARRRAAAALVTPLETDLVQLRAMLQARRVTIDDLPADLKRQWIAADGQARVEVLPKGDASNDRVLLRFARAVEGIAPDATGNPVSLVGSRRTVLAAFERAGAYAVAAISVVLLAVLRRPRDVLVTLLPLLVAGVLTLELCVLTGQELNFANIIALPLLLGIGVAFKIYYVMAWRRGSKELLQSTLTRAVVFSALTTGAAFVSLWLSPEPGLSSMGELMILALVCTLGAAVLFQPALMGPPRETSRQGAGEGAR